MSRQFKKNQIATYICIALSATASASAVAAEKDKKALDDIEVIQVSGIRSSLTSALNTKRGAEMISDSIIAEEIGKSSDENIAQALSRVSGVSLDRNGGDTQTVTVRGVQAALNDIKLNGVSMTSNTDNQSVDLSLFSADVLSRIDVIKSPSANQEEGSLGASINLQTRAPLSSAKNVNVVTVEARHNDLSEESTPRFAYTGIYNLDDTMGFAASIFHDEQSVRKDEFNTFRTAIRKFSSNDKSGNAAKKVINADTGEVIPGDTFAVAPDFYLNRLGLDDKTKQGGTFTFQYRPSEQTDIRFDASFSRQEIKHLQSHTRMHALHRNPYEITVKLGDDSTSNSVVAAKTGHIGGLNQSGRWTNTTDSLVLGLEFEHFIGEDWVISGRVGHSGTEQEFTDGYRMNWMPNFAGKLGNETQEKPWCGIEYSEGPQGDFLPGLNFCAPTYDGNDPSTMKLTQFRSDHRDVDDSKNSVYFDASRAIEANGIDSVEFGFKYTSRSKSVSSGEAFFGPDVFENRDKILASDIPGADSSSITGGKFLDGIAHSGMPSDWIYPDIDATVAHVFPNGLDQDLFVQNPLKAWEVNEKTYGAYAQANYELLDGDITGNFGIRYAKTEIDSKGSSGIKFAKNMPFLVDGEEVVYYPVADEKAYDNWLPSVTLNWVVEDDLIFRASAAKVMARPEINSLRPNYDIKANNLEEVPVGAGGNTQLDPFEVNQFDMSLEWYFEEGALLSGAVFVKDFKSFTYNTSSNQEFENPLTNTCIVDRSIYDGDDKLTATSPCADINFSQTVNGGSAEIKGLELTYQQYYSFLPGLLSNLGSSVNYTYADSEAIIDPDNAENPFNGLPFVNTSKHSANTTVFWEDDKLSLRLAYAYRSEALSKTVNRDSSIVRDARGTLDFTASYDVTEKMKVSFSAMNLTDSYDVFYDVVNNPKGRDGIVSEVTGELSDISKDRVSSIFDYGSSYRLSVRYAF